MREPQRWLDGGAPAEVRELLRQGEAPRPLSEQARARSRSRVAALSALPIAAGFMLWLPQVALGAVLGVAGTGVVVMVSERFAAPPAAPAPTAPAPVKAIPRDAPVAPPAPAPAPLESVAPLAPAPPAPPARAPSLNTPPEVEPPAVRNSLDIEIALLEQARRQLATNPSAALAALRRHELEFPGGQLRIEREFLIVDALVRSGNRAAAEARARSLEAQAPRSLYGERLKRILSGKTP